MTPHLTCVYDYLVFLGCTLIVLSAIWTAVKMNRDKKD